MIVRDPAQAIAMAKCWLASWMPPEPAAFGLPPTGSFHPDACGFCDMPRDLLIRVLEEFQTWSEISSYDDEVPLKAEIEAWQTLSPAQQDIKVRHAQGYVQPDRGREREDRRAPW
jgi:hypothetical protein